MDEKEKLAMFKQWIRIYWIICFLAYPFGYFLGYFDQRFF